MHTHLFPYSFLHFLGPLTLRADIIDKEKQVFDLPRITFLPLGRKNLNLILIVDIRYFYIKEMYLYLLLRNKTYISCTLEFVNTGAYSTHILLVLSTAGLKDIQGCQAAPSARFPSYSAPYTDPTVERKPRGQDVHSCFVYTLFAAGEDQFKNLLALTSFVNCVVFSKHLFSH